MCSNIIKVKTNNSDRGLHIAQKPLQLMELLVSLVTIEGETVLDPFMGSGTTCVAAHNLNRHYFGIEIDEKYAEIAQRRLNNKSQSFSKDRASDTPEQLSINIE